MNELNKKMLLTAAFGLALLLGGCKDATQTAMRPAAPVEVDVITLKGETVQLVTELPGRTAPFRVAEVRPQVSGIVQKRLFTEGSEVTAGQLLYQIDAAAYQARFDSARAALSKAEIVEHSARLNDERYRTLVRTKAVSEQEQIEVEAAWKQAVANVAAARAVLDSARIDLDHTRVTAPITGRIGKSMISEGALVTAQQSVALAIIQQLDPLYVDVSQSSNELLRLKRELSAGALADGTPRPSVVVLLEDGSSYGQNGVLEFSDVTVDQSTGTVTLRAVVPNPDQELLPGMFVRARVVTGERQDAVAVPAASIVRTSKGEATVMLVDAEKKVVARIIQTGRNLGERVLVREGLAPGDQVIVAGLQKIKPGVVVTTVEQGAAGEQGQSAGAGSPVARVE